MGTIEPHHPVLRIVAAFSQFEDALDWGRDQAIEAWGPLALESERFAFTETNYYQQSMGSGLRKTFWAFEQRMDPAELPAAKHRSNAWEDAYRDLATGAEERPLNLDPGYITPAKLVLATTKDRDHRIYLRDGIYAEVTLHFQAKAWRARDWTYPDYRREDFQAFFTKCRNYLRSTPG